MTKHLVLFLLFPLVAGHVFAALQAQRPRVDGLPEPLATDGARPMLSWALAVDPGERNVMQAACQVQAATSREKLVAGQPDLWDSGRVVTPATRPVALCGKGALSPPQRVYWRARLEDDKGKAGPWCEPDWFETGLLKQTDSERALDRN